MVSVDLTGARPSNAGDEFHELWALQQILKLLDQGTPLRAVTVEGLRTSDEVGAEPAAWEGVDCAFYHGGDSLATATRFVLDQLKYSSANPETAWTVSRLCAATNKRQDNSVVAHLAAAYQAVRNARPEFSPGREIVIRLVSNQPVAPEVVRALAGVSAFASDRERLRAASRLDPEDFGDFSVALDLTETGAVSRYALDAAVVANLAALTEDDARVSRDELMRWLRTRYMMPDRPQEPITLADLLIQLAGSADPATLFPCEPALKRIVDPIPRAATQTIVRRLQEGAQRLILVGEGGCGKTTALFEVSAGLQQGSEMILFDCYGAGRYLDSDAQRHRPHDAFLQLSNDLARQLRTPLLISRTKMTDAPRTFKRRLVDTALLVAARGPEALLVVAIDAADNAVTAAINDPLKGQSFLPGFVGLGDLPANVRLILSARPGRIQGLHLPHTFEMHEIGPFTPEETAAHARRSWSEAPEVWLQDFHALSNGNPRVQEYALGQAGTDHARATDALRPTGKSLDAVFFESFNAALRKAGSIEELTIFCAALIALPRPAPLSHIAAVTQLDEAQVRNLVADLRTGGLRLAGDGVGFADEDLEQFVRAKASDALDEVRGRIADRLQARRADDAYAAAHVAGALLAAGRRNEIVTLVKEEAEAHAIADPVRRREVQLHRLAVAMKVCRDTGCAVDAAMTIIAGAEAVRTDAAITELLVDNPDLAVRFAPESVSRLLRDSQSIAIHGPLLMHRMAQDSRNGDDVAVREGLRRLGAWARRRNDATCDDEGATDAWPISCADNAAAVAALIRTEGPAALQRRLRGWPPRQLLDLAVVASGSLATAGEHQRLADWLELAPPPRLYRFIPLTYLALLGRPVDAEELLSSLERAARTGSIDIDTVDTNYRGDDASADLADLFMTGCEVALANGAAACRVSELSDNLRPPSLRRRRHVVNATQLALALRAHALCETIAGNDDVGGTFLTDEPDPDAIRRGDQRDDTAVLVAAAAPLYATRARLLLGKATVADLRLPVTRETWRLESFTRSHTLKRLCGWGAVALARLCHVPDLVGPEIALRVVNCAETEPAYPLTAETKHLEALSLHSELHSNVLDEIAKRAAAIKELRTTASEKSRALIELARILAPVSEQDAQAIFEDAVAVAGEVDNEMAFALRTLTGVLARGIDRMSDTDRGVVATGLVVAASDIGLRLDNTDVMPWEAVIEALVRLDLGVAMAALARWDDEGLVHRRFNLSALVMSGLGVGAISAERATALTALMEHTEPQLLAAIVQAARRHAPERRRAIAEEIARDECLYHSRGEREAVLELVRPLAGSAQTEGWAGALNDLATAHTRFQSGAPAERRGAVKRDRPSERIDPLSNVDWRSPRWTTPEAIDAVLDDLLSQRRETGAFFSIGEALDRMAAVVQPADRVDHLNAVVALRSEGVASWELGDVLKRRLAEWRDQPAIGRWRRESLLEAVTQHLPGFCRGLAHGYAPLPDLLTATGASEARIHDAVLRGIEQGVEQLDASALYALVDLIGGYEPPETAKAIAQQFVERLAAAVPDRHRRPPRNIDLPKNPTEAIAKFLYALMSDVEVPLRWRAAHAVRRLARLGDTEAIDALVQLLDHRDERAFRNPDAPFYWLSARLWLLIALDRVGDEAPQMLVPHTRRLLAAATDEELPHVLMRAFAASALTKLVDRSVVVLAKAEAKALAAVNTPAQPASPTPHSFDRGFGHVPYDEIRSRRYQFDTMDTVPYWYGSAARIFADVTPDLFLDTAEAFIVDLWSDGGVERSWDSQPRRTRLLGQHPLSTMHRHGSRPSLERWDTHVEWHAMFCTVGTLLRTQAPAEADDFYDRNIAANWLQREGLTAPPLWLSDRLAPTPTPLSDWRDPEDQGTWLEEAEEDRLRALVGLDADGPIVSGGYWVVSGRRTRFTVNVCSALVRPEEAPDLLTKLARTEHHEYFLPAEDDEHASDSSHRFIGWLRHGDTDAGLDVHDPLRNGVDGGFYRPGLAAHEVLKLTRGIEVGRLTWRQPDGRVAFIAEAWGDLAGDQDERRVAYSDRARSDGYRLSVSRPSLRTFLCHSGLDILIEVTLTKFQNSDAGRPSYDENSCRAHTRLYLLRRDGSLHVADGMVSQWSALAP
ncbi:hypothetical protein L1787_05980 [Acuticoccus sp. M5D2P5]|uniref:hypothetical protein n=1 Tax=Acuticoccus kalidii TaxID=2910977 RepID=UPI001F41812B|nr:hypothetical protein [Acuticoccus kalidii]MCF3932962.1 hypothetical protein [Acuticoccus kalidii]